MMSPRRGFALLFSVVSLIAVPVAAQSALVTYRVRPSDTDPSITRYDAPHYIVFDSTRPKTANLFVFMSGTGGSPGGMSDFLNVVAGQGYRVISLAYNDEPAVIQVCPRDPDPRCSEQVRQKRIFGDDATSRIDDTPAESIVNRLVKLLIKLDHDHPSEGWGQYLTGDSPNWERIVVSGHSQGAGMAAYMAQRKLVARVVLFSSPWDYYGRNREIAPWVRDGNGVTPRERWFGAVHEKENTAALIAQEYLALKIPEANARVLKLEPAFVTGPNPYHLSIVGNRTTPRDAAGLPAYANDWRFLVGTSP
jgi:pimeloyl-ACP methyl ester carboxylesterase